MGLGEHVEQHRPSGWRDGGELVRRQHLARGELGLFVRAGVDLGEHLSLLHPVAVLRMHEDADRMVDLVVLRAPAGPKVDGERGRGLFIVDAVADEVVVRSDADRTVVRCAKRVRQAIPA